MPTTSRRRQTKTNCSKTSKNSTDTAASKEWERSCTKGMLSATSLLRAGLQSHKGRCTRGKKNHSTLSLLAVVAHCSTWRIRLLNARLRRLRYPFRRSITSREQSPFQMPTSTSGDRSEARGHRPVKTSARSQSRLSSHYSCSIVSICRPNYQLGQTPLWLAIDTGRVTHRSQDQWNLFLWMTLRKMNLARFGRQDQQQL